MSSYAGSARGRAGLGRRDGRAAVALDGTFPRRAIGRGLLARGARGVGVDDEYGNRAVVERVVTDASEQRGGQRAAAARAHDEEVVVAGFHGAGQRGPDRPAADDGGHGHVGGHALDGALDDLDRLTLELQHAHGGGVGADRGGGPDRWLADGGQDRDPAVAGVRDVNRFVEGSLCVIRAVDADEDVPEHDISLQWPRTLSMPNISIATATMAT